MQKYPQKRQVVRAEKVASRTHGLHRTMGAGGVNRSAAPTQQPQPPSGVAAPDTRGATLPATGQSRDLVTNGTMGAADPDASSESTEG